MPTRCFSLVGPTCVMAGRVPAIHVFRSYAALKT
jgi:hypothetical protein